MVLGLQGHRSRAPGGAVENEQGELPREILKRSRLSPETIASAFGITLTATNSTSSVNISKKEKNYKDTFELFLLKAKNRQDTFSDALSSFLYSLRTAIFVENDALRGKRFEAFLGEPKIY